MSADTQVRAQPEPERPAPGRGQRVLRGAGEVLITLGLVLLLFVFYQVYVTDFFAAHKQHKAEDALENAWRNGRGDLDLIEGAGMAKLYIPALGADYHFVVVQGTSQADLEVGPGHYVHSALPGRRGNFAIAGHRVGKGAPFNDIDLIRPCDAMVVETASNWFVYRMLPTSPGTASADTASAGGRCAGMPALRDVSPDYADTVGREIVLPTQGEVIAPVPHHPDTRLRPGGRAPLITLTTCNPKFSDAQRLIVHGVLVRTYPKNGAQAPPPELTETA